MYKSKRTQGTSSTTKSGSKKIKFGLTNAETADLKGINSLFSQKKKEPRTHFTKKKTSSKTHLKKKTRKPVTQFGGCNTKSEEDDENENEAKTIFASENYTQNYLKKKQEKIDNAKQIDPIDKKKEAEKELEKQKDAQQRARAQWLQEQIFIWKRKLNTGEFEDTVIRANITIYEREFYSIDQRYRP